MFTSHKRWTLASLSALALAALTLGGCVYHHDHGYGGGHQGGHHGGHHGGHWGGHGGGHGGHHR